MAGTGGPPVPSGSGGKKAVDFQINLIPMIDLLSVLISFLLMTAVWTQISRIDVRQNEGTDPEPRQLEPPEEALELGVLITEMEYQVTAQGRVLKAISRTSEADAVESLSQTLEKVHSEHGEKAETIQVTSEDDIPYQSVIHVLDICLEHGISGISVAGVDG
jgi:biopolymer transport protein ExbD